LRRPECCRIYDDPERQDGRERAGVFVLIHGGGHSSRCWERVVPLLDAPVRALDLPGRGVHPAPLDEVRLADSIASVAADIEGADLRDVVLVGHSMAGLILAGVIERVHARLRHVVFVSCAVPPDGGTLLDLVPPAIAAIAASAVPTPAGVALDPALVATMQCYDMDDEQTAFTLEVVVPEAYWPTREPVDLAGLARPVPRTWIELLRDRTFEPAAQVEMARRTGCVDVVEIDSGHMAMISHPQELAAALNAIHASH
jgi:pimeloyl-ACP methyl ester carboxylesterase